MEAQCWVTGQNRQMSQSGGRPTLLPLSGRETAWTKAASAPLRLGQDSEGLPPLPPGLSVQRCHTVPKDMLRSVGVCGAAWESETEVPSPFLLHVMPSTQHVCGLSFPSLWVGWLF